MPGGGCIRAREPEYHLVAGFIVPVERLPPVLCYGICSEFSIADSAAPADYIFIMCSAYPFLGVEIEADQKCCGRSFGK